jgi:hypothetical protein
MIGPFEYTLPLKLGQVREWEGQGVGRTECKHS